jgi:hypothetical protein
MKVYDRSYVHNSVHLSLPRYVPRDGTGSVNTRNKVIAYEQVAATDYKEFKGAGLNRTPLT